MPSKVQWLIAALFALLLASVSLWWFKNHEYEQFRVELPPTGEARYNPFYQIKRSLEHAGITAYSAEHLQLQDLQAHDTLVLDMADYTLDDEQASALLRWVEGGGNLLLTKNALESSTLRNHLAVHFVDTEIGTQGSCVQLHHADTIKEVFCDMPNLLLMDTQLVLQQLRAQNGTLVYARLAHGRGEIGIIAALDYMKNLALEPSINRALAWRMLQRHQAPQQAGAVHFIYRSKAVPLLKLLLLYGWPVWVPLCVALLGWMYWRSQRRGPLLPTPALARRALLEHVRASGMHYYRYGKHQLLYQALLTAYQRRLQRRDPLIASLPPKQAREALQQRTGLALTTIDAALHPPQTKDARDFRHRIASLNLLRRRL